MHFGRIGLEDVSVFFGILAQDIGEIPLRQAPQERRLVFHRHVRRRHRREHKRARHRVNLGVDQFVDRDLTAFGRERIDIDDDGLELAAEHAAGGIDFLHRQRGAVEIILMIGDPGLRCLRGGQPDQDRLRRRATGGARQEGRRKGCRRGARRSQIQNISTRQLPTHPQPQGALVAGLIADDAGKVTGMWKRLSFARAHGLYRQSAPFWCCGRPALMA